MKTINRIAISVCLYTMAASPANGANGIEISHHDALSRITYLQGGVEADAENLKPGSLTLSFDALGRTFDIQLDPNYALFTAASRASIPDHVSVYRGGLVGRADSWARIVIANGMPRGLVSDDGELFAIEAPGASAISTKVPIVYRLADASIANGAMSCALASEPKSGATAFQSIVGELQQAVARAPGAVSEMSLGAIADFEYTDARGASAESSVISRMNIVDGIFSEQLGVQLSLQLVEMFTDANDPFTDVSDAGDLLEELANYRQNTNAQSSLGLTHLFTGRELVGSTVGIAFGGTLCRTFSGAGLTQGTHGEMFDSLIAAHEIGHNFGAPHDGQAGSACEAETGSFIMAPSISGSDQFSACSITEMQDNVARASCISALPNVDMSIRQNGQQPTVLLGSRVALDFDVANNGTIGATGVVANIEIPNNVTFISFATTAGSCTNGASNVTCTIGAVAGNSGATVTVTGNANSVGNGTFVATVASDLDDNAVNNQLDVLLAVEPAVSLVVTQPADAQVQSGSSISIRVTLQNQSILAASGVALSTTLNSGLRAETATLSIGTCTVTAQQVDCQASTFAAQSSATFDISVSGVAIGAQNYDLTISATEEDTFVQDNSFTGTVNVNEAGVDNGGGDDDGGSGAFGVLVVSILAAMAMVRRTRKSLVYRLLKP